PPQGAHQALVNDDASRALTTDALESFLGLTAGTLGGSNGNVGTAIKQTITVSAGTTLTFDWNFLTNKLLAFNPGISDDFAFFSVTNGSASTEVQIDDSDSVQSLSTPTPTLYSAMSGYQTYTYTFTAAGTYTLGFGIVQPPSGGGYFDQASAILFDNIV